MKNENYKKIKTFPDACLAAGTTEDEFNAKFEGLGLDDDTLNYEKLKIVTKAINGVWIPDWNNEDKAKYWPWFSLSSGFRFCNSFYGYSDAYTCAGSRLCFETRAQSDYAGTEFTQLYKGFMTISK